jgi:hypothetical protein
VNFRQLISICSTALVLLVATCAKAQVKDPLVAINDLTFGSPFEEKVFKEITTNPDFDIVRAFVAADGSSTEADYEAVKKKLEEVKKHIKAGSSKASTINAIFNALKIEFLRNHQARTTFSDMIEHGNFNTYTATAAYIYMFKQFAIDYEIHESANPFITLVADPAESKLVIETGTIDQEHILISDEMKIRFSAFLANHDVVDSTDALRRAAFIWTKYSISESNITDKQLLSLFYFDTGIKIALDKISFQPGVCLEKACFLDVSYKNRFFITLILSADAEGKSFADERVLTSFIKAINYSTDGSNYGPALSWFQENFKTIYVEQNEPATMEHIYNRIMAESIDSNYRTMIKIAWYFQKARVLSAEGKHNEALAAADLVYLLDRDTEESLNLIANCIYERVKQSEESEKVALDGLEKYCEKYKGLKSLDRVKYTFALGYLSLASKAFYNNQLEKGVSYMNKFKALGEVKMDYSYIGDVYSEWSSYYARKNNAQKARQYLLEGLKISPNNPTLKRKLKLLDDYTTKGKY